MATPVGTNVVTSIARRHIIPEITDNIYTANPLFFRLNRANKRITRGGTQIEVPLMYKKMASGGWYQGFDQLDTTPSDTVKNGAWDWAQANVNVAVDGLTLIKTDQPEAIADFIRLYFSQAEMEMVDILGEGCHSDGSNAKSIVGLEGAVDDGTTLDTYGGLSRTTNTWWKAQVVADATNRALTLAELQTDFGNASEGGRTPTIIISGQDLYNDYYVLSTDNQRFPSEPAGHDVQLAQAGFSHLLFNGTPWVVDPKVATNTAGTSYLYMLNEDYIYLAVSPRADFYVEDFQVAINQDAMVSKLLWAGQLIFTNCARQLKDENFS